MVPEPAPGHALLVLCGYSVTIVPADDGETAFFILCIAPGSSLYLFAQFFLCMIPATSAMIPSAAITTTGAAPDFVAVGVGASDAVAAVFET
jgi:hypothetical protein